MLLSHYFAQCLLIIMLYYVEMEKCYFPITLHNVCLLIISAMRTWKM